MSTVHEEGHDDQQCKIDWTLLIKSTFYLHFKLGMTTNYRVATGVDNIDYQSIIDFLAEGSLAVKKVQFFNI